MAEDATSTLSDMTPQPAANPDAQTTVNDFLDYTEFFPSDLLRSLRLIGDLDTTYLDATLTVHELTKTYGRLPDIPAGGRPDPVVLRRQIATALDKAIYCRESTFAEASRLYEVAERHVRRLAIIKTKLQALPQPPSRDPTPAPVSPQASRSVNRYDRTPRLHLHYDPTRHGASTARQRDRSRKSVGALHRGHSISSDGSDDDSDIRSTIDLAASRVKIPKEKAPRPPKPPRVRPSGPAPLSTSSALAMLSPPPPDAKPGSKFAPWLCLTEYEMAVLRKQMKKNALWTPSDTMVNRELDRKQRNWEHKEKEEARCKALGIVFLDEKPDKPSVASVAPPVSAEPIIPAPVNTNATVEPVATPVESPRDGPKEDTAIATKGTKANDAKEAKNRESQREQAMRDAQELEDATRKIKEAAATLKELNFTPVTARGKSAAKPNNKRKRDSSPPATAETPTAVTREASHASQDSGTKPPEPKRLRLNLQPIAPAPVNAQQSIVPAPATTSTPRTSTPVVPSPVANTPVPLPDTAKTITVQVPLAPAGPGTPKAPEKPASRAPSLRLTPALPSPAENKKSPPPPTPAQPVATAASSRPRRESVAPTKVSSPPPAPAAPPKAQKTPTPAPEPIRSSPVSNVRPRSARGHVPTPKAQSEEPKPLDAGKPTRELRRHSIFSQSAIAAPTRMSTRKKPPPKGDVTSAENGQKTVTNVKRSQGSKNMKKKKADEDATEPADDIDPDEPRYCICDDVSYGQMISCDNHCEKEWFHLECVGMTEKDIPSRRAKWYCPDCRQQLNVDAYGNPSVPPPLPGRRGNRSVS